MELGQDVLEVFRQEWQQLPNDGPGYDVIEDALSWKKDKLWTKWYKLTKVTTYEASVDETILDTSFNFSKSSTQMSVESLRRVLEKTVLTVSYTAKDETSCTRRPSGMISPELGTSLLK